MINLLQKAFFSIRFNILHKLKGLLLKLWFTLQGMEIGKGTTLASMYISWPHKVKLGDNCKLEHEIHFKFDGYWKKGQAIIIGNNVFLGCGCEFNITDKIVVGDDCLIGSGCRFIDHDHGTKSGVLMREQVGKEQAIIIGSDVWLGVNVVVLKGVEIGKGAIVAAGAVVTRSIPAYEIWGGIPARKMGVRT